MPETTVEGGGTSDKQRFGRVLWQLAELEDADSSRRSFRARAYANAVWALDHLSPELGEAGDEVLALPGVGPGVVGLLEEFRVTGTVRRLETLRAALPAESARLRRLPRMAASRLRWLKANLGVDTTHDLRRSIESGALDEMPGVGEATAALWAVRLELLAPDEMPIVRAVAYARRWVRHLHSHVPGVRAMPTGAVRRLDETVRVIDLVVVGDGEVDRFLTGSALVTAMQPDHGGWRVVTLGGVLVVHPAVEGVVGTAFVVTTGPPEHVESLGPLPEAPDEAEVYGRLGLQYVPAPARHQLPPPPDLVSPGLLRGDLHLHSDWSSDGRQSLPQVVAAALSRSYRYIAVTDHAVGLRFGGLTVDELRRQREAIEGVREDHPGLVVLHGAELNIGREGTLDYDDEILSWLDFRLASVHSYFDLDVVEQTRRLLRVVENPLVHAIGHLTGRRIGVRPGIRLDFEAVFEAAAETSTALEVNGHLDRLDLSAELSRQAQRRGALFLANSDAHRPGETDNVIHAVGVLQRAHVPGANVVNTWEPSRFLRWVEAGGGR